MKDLIKADYNADPVNVKAVFLFGHVPVPYSGIETAFDDHGEHDGAWPADVFYGDMTDTGWSDNRQTAFKSNRRPANNNALDDGKFDQNHIPDDVELQVGRVDLSNMPTFPKSESELLRQYLNKDHDFRHNLFPFNNVARRGLIDDNFNGYTVTGINGYRNFSAFFGADNIHANTENTAIDWFPTLGINSYLWGYGSGGGHRQGATGVGTTGNFASTDTKVVFTMLFGSYFGDWNSTDTFSQDNFLRAPLATTTYGLTSSWSGYPHWFYHHMGLGETIGYSTRLSQNNGDLYTGQGNEWVTKKRGVHVALMGDPTLRLHPVTPPSDLNATLIGGGVDLRWTAAPVPPDGNLRGYHVYRRVASSNGPFTRLTTTGLIPGTTYTDSTVLSGEHTYMVRAVKLESSVSGSYFNSSQGIFRTINLGTPPPPSPGTLQFSTASYSVSEDVSGGIAMISVSRTGGSDGAVSVNYATGNGTAIAGSDYTAASGTLTFANGDSATKTFTVPITNDTGVEPNETVNLTLSNPTGATLGTPTTAVLTIADNDATVQFSAAAYSVTEGTATAAFTVTRTGITTTAASVNYATINGSATAGSDYTSTSGTLNFAAGETSKTFTVPIANDTLAEPNETVSLTLSSPTGASLGAPTMTVLTIVDNDSGGTASGVLINFNSSGFFTNEGKGFELITVYRYCQVGGCGENTVAFSVNYATSNDTAVAGSDYTATSGTLNFAVGGSNVATFIVPIIDDVAVEPGEFVNMTLSNPTNGAALGSIPTSRLKITSNDFTGTPQPTTTVQFSAASYSVNEGIATATITATRAGSSTTAVGVSYVTSNGTTLVGSDYTASSGTLSWAVGDAASKTFTVPIINDAVVESSETVNLTLHSPTGGISLGTQNTAVLTIADNDGAASGISIHFNSSEFYNTETNGFDVITVYRAGPGQNTVAFSVDYTTSNDTAVAGSDYTTTNGTLNFTVGGPNSLTFIVPILDDTIVEPVEFVTLTLTNPTNGATLATPTARLKIGSND